MNKRKLIKKLALPAGIIAAISLALILMEIPYNKMQYQNHLDDFKKYQKTFIDQNTIYLKEFAGKIKSIPADPVIVKEVESEYMIEHQKSGQPKRYLWMSSMNGDFIFGVPAEAFQKLNDGFDKYQEIIKTDESYRDRNDFLKKLIDRFESIDFSQFDRNEYRERYYDENKIRYFRNEEEWGLIQPTATSFSTPVYDDKGKLLGELFMKVDDKVNIEKYFNIERFEKSELFAFLYVLAIILLSISGAFLWFLLPTWVYTDAKERDVKTPGIWAFLALTSLFFGLTIYLITRPSTLKSFNCPKCDGELNGTRAYCPHCGYDLANTFCQQCQYPIKPEWQFCPNCRAETKSKEMNKAEILNT